MKVVNCLQFYLFTWIKVINYPITFSYANLKLDWCQIKNLLQQVCLATYFVKDLYLVEEAEDKKPLGNGEQTVKRRREQRCICRAETLLHCLSLLFLFGLGCNDKVTQISAWQHPKYFPGIPEQPKSWLSLPLHLHCHLELLKPAGCNCQPEESCLEALSRDSECLEGALPHFLWCFIPTLGTLVPSILPTLLHVMLFYFFPWFLFPFEWPFHLFFYSSCTA